jgi:hypothetical protein
MIMVSASIDATVTIFRNTGVFIKREAGLWIIQKLLISSLAN